MVARGVHTLIVLFIILSPSYSFSTVINGAGKRRSSSSSIRTRYHLQRSTGSNFGPLFSSIITIPYSATNISDVFIRNSYNLTGIICGDGFQCDIPNRDFGTTGGISFNGPSSHQLLMKWDTGPNRLLFLCKPDEQAQDALIIALQALEKKNVKVFVEDAVFTLLAPLNFPNTFLYRLSPQNEEKLDLIIAFGGDGLLMHANTLFADGVPPIMCVDFGSLGFLAPFTFEEYQEELDKILQGAALLTLRMRLHCSIVRDQKIIASYRVLNEAVVDRGPSPYLSTIDLKCDQQYLTTVQGDGIIISTPTGSTAYSLAAGGSMVHPSVPAILLTPICAHTLSFRPLLLPDSCTLTAEIPLDCRASAWVSFDGKFRQELMKGDRLEVKMSSYPMPTINRLNFTADWFQALRSAFMFNERPRQKPFKTNPTPNEPL